MNNPYPGSSRSLVRGQPYGDLDLTVSKKFPITERLSAGAFHGSLQRSQSDVPRHWAVHSLERVTSPATLRMDLEAFPAIHPVTDS